MNQNNSIIKQYTKQIENNVKSAIEMQRLAAQSAMVDDKGNWSFTIYQENDIVAEKIGLEISKDNVSIIAPPEMVKAMIEEMSREAVLEKDEAFKSSQQNKIEYFKSLSEEKRRVLDNNVRQYIKQNPQIHFDATKNILISNGVMPKIVNRALQESANRALKQEELKEAKIINENDNGYCTKSLFIPLYEFKNRYGGFEWLPESAEIASHPTTMINHLKAHKENAVSDMVNLNSEIVKYQPGTIIMVDQGHGHMHAMMYNGLNKNTNKPQYIGFNSNDLNRSISDRRVGIIINLPQMIQDDIDAGKIKEKEQAEEISREFKDTAINIEGQPIPLYKDSLSRGEVAETVSMKIERLKKRVKGNSEDEYKEKNNQYNHNITENDIYMKKIENLQKKSL